MGVSSLLCLGWRAWKARSSDGWKSLTVFAGMLACLTFSSHAYCFRFLYGDIYPRWFFFLGEICGPLDYVFAGATIWLRFLSGRRWLPSQMAFSAFVFLVCLLLSVNYAILPIQSASEGFDTASRVINVVAWHMATALLAVALLSSQQTTTVTDTIFLQSIVLILISAIATEHQLAVSQYEVASWAEIGWAMGFVGLALAVVLDVRGRSAVLQRPAELSEWFSLRCLIGISAFASGAVLLVGLWLTGVVRLQHGSQVAMVLLLIYACWCASNFVALVLANKIRDVRSRMLAPATLDGAAFDAFKIQALPQQTFLAEVDSIIDGYNERVAQLQVLNAVLLENERQAALGKVAAQVAHDIRSPLAALSVVLPGLRNVDEDRRLLLRDGIHRIQDIAQDLLRFHERGDAAEQDEEGQLLVSIAIEQIASQVRLQQRHRLNLSIESDVPDSCACLCVRAQPTRFKRILSNLMNNAVEAIDDKGTVTVALKLEAGNVVVEVVDTGRGMPPAVLERLGERGFTSGKASGHGLGVHQARLQVETWGGSLEFSSEMGRGTQATLRIPLATAAPWIQTEIWTDDVRRVVVLDDDVSIHRVWRERFNDSIELVSCATLESFRRASADWSGDSSTLFFVDYELGTSKVTGLDIISETQLCGATLVTSHFEEPRVIAACLDLGVRMIPKMLAAKIPIRQDWPNKPEVSIPEVFAAP